MNIRKIRLPAAAVTAGLVTVCAIVSGCSATPGVDAREPAHVDLVPLKIVGGEVATSATTRNFTIGDTVDLEVTSDAAHEIHVHGYDLMRVVHPTAPTSIRFTATIPGEFEAEIEDTHTVIFRFDVR